MPYRGVLSRFQVVCAKPGNDKLTGLAGGQMPGPFLAGQLLLIDFLLQHQERVD